MKIVIAGAGSVGRYMAKQLAASGHTIVVIDNDASAVSRLQNTDTITSLQGDACEVDVLAAAGAAGADVVAAVTGDD